MVYSDRCEFMKEKMNDAEYQKKQRLALEAKEAEEKKHREKHAARIQAYVAYKRAKAAKEKAAKAVNSNSAGEENCIRLKIISLNFHESNHS